MSCSFFHLLLSTSQSIEKKPYISVFFGFNVHVWFGYFDAFGTRQGYWTYPHQMFPFIPNSLGMDASLVPVLFMLVYQWCINKNKNYYLYTLILSAILSFLLKPIFVALNLFKFYMGTNYFHLFLTYIVIIVLSKLITNLFLFFQKESNLY
ncbi:CBO0543 family protein [Bacillus solitudinis]|uniref:CBO0543 family protein n=1 Tax=Bacillus solitudinis TaxID=2014074 RepID=UPI0029DE7ABF|nr:CBO0543 family protein [Bacillus solitudinis]